MGVTKGQPPEVVREAVEQGLVLFGENKVQEAKAKIPLCPGRARWHMIGHLQSNKCRDAVLLFEMIHGVDSLELARELNKWAERSAKTVKVLLEVNVSGEASKFGISPGDVEGVVDGVNGLNRLELHGFMGMAPWSQDVERARPFFRKLKGIKESTEARLGVPVPELSMGMSGDFEVAIEEGATMVRIGTALFGARRFVGKGTSNVAGE